MDKYLNETFKKEEAAIKEAMAKVESEIQETMTRSQEMIEQANQAATIALAKAVASIPPM